MRKWSKEEIRELLDTNPWAVTRGVIAIYKLQTESEKVSHSTLRNNGVGFNALDAGILSSFAEQLMRNERELSTKQFAIAKKLIRKYAGQLTKIANGEIVIS